MNSVYKHWKAQHLAEEHLRVNNFVTGVLTHSHLRLTVLCNFPQSCMAVRFRAVGQLMLYILGMNLKVRLEDSVALRISTG